MSEERPVGTVVVAAALAQRMHRGGHAWVVLSYLLGFRRLGWRVTLVDRLPPEPVGDRDGHLVTPERSPGYAYACGVLEQFGLADTYYLLVDGQRQPLGRSRDALLDDLQGADLLLNVMGFLDDPELREAARRSAFLDIDPGFTQMWADLGLADILSDHDSYLTVGTNIGRAGCRIPTLGRSWRPTVPPVVMEHWAPQPGFGRAVTTVASWRGPFDPVEYHGTRYGLRAHEFRSLATVAEGTTWPMEIALDIEPEDAADRARLVACGWQIADPFVEAGTPGAYRRYVQDSTAEFMVAKGMYVLSASGWISDRSACYLASGRPVVAQDTGIVDQLPTGDGLVLFSTAAEAELGLADVLGRYHHHADAARSLAEDHFDSDKVIPALIESVFEPA